MDYKLNFTQKATITTQLKQINNTKEYTLIATPLLKEIIFKAKISQSAKFCWLTLWDLCKFKDVYKATISSLGLAKMLNRDPRSIFRYIKELQEEGFLVVQNNHNKKNRQTQNTYYLKIPEEMEKKIRACKNRRPPKTHCDPHQLEAPRYDKDVVHYTKSRSSIYKDNSIPRVMKENSNSKSVKSYSQSHEEDNNWSKDKVNPNIHYLNRPTSLDGHQKKTLIKEKERLLAIKKDLCIKTDKLKECLDEILDNQGKVSERYDVFKKYTLNHDVLNTLNGQIGVLEDKLSGTHSDPPTLGELVDRREDLVICLRGGRLVSIRLLSRLKKALICCGILKKDVNRYINEILFAVRFGELSRRKDGEGELDIERGIAIALRLIREKRWTTPKSMKINLKHYLS